MCPGVQKKVIVGFKIIVSGDHHFVFDIRLGSKELKGSKNSQKYLKFRTANFSIFHSRKMRNGKSTMENGK
jgi:hypothetical protein